MISVVVRADGSVQLGDAAQALGYRPGAVVQIIVTGAGSLILAIDDRPAVDVPCTAMTGGARQGALRERWRR